MTSAVAIVGVIGCFWRLGINHKAFYSMARPRLLLEGKSPSFIRGFYYASMVMAFVEYLILYGLVTWLVYAIGRQLWG